MESAVFFNLLTVIGVLFLILASGFLCRKWGLIDDAGSKRFSKMIVNVCQPLMLVGALVAKDFSFELLREGLLYLLLGMLLHPFMALVAFLLRPIYPAGEQRQLSQFATIFANCGFLGFPIMEAIFPGKGAFYGAFFVIGFHIYIWTLGIFIISRGREDIKLTPKKAFFNFGTIPCAIGFCLYLLKAVCPMPDFTISFFTKMGDLCMPISVLITGSLIATQNPKKMLSNPRLYIFNAIKLILLPLIVCFTIKLCTLWMEDSYGIVLFCTMVSALPSAALVTMFAEIYNMDAGYASQTVATTSLLSVGTLPLMYFIGDMIARI